MEEKVKIEVVDKPHVIFKRETRETTLKVNGKEVIVRASESESDYMNNPDDDFDFDGDYDKLTEEEKEELDDYTWDIDWYPESDEPMQPHSAITDKERQEHAENSIQEGIQLNANSGQSNY